MAMLKIAAQRTLTSRMTLKPSTMTMIKKNFAPVCTTMTTSDTTMISKRLYSSSPALMTNKRSNKNKIGLFGRIRKAIFGPSRYYGDDDNDDNDDNNKNNPNMIMDSSSQYSSYTNYNHYEHFYDDKFVTYNVRGTIFQIPKSTLVQKYKNSVLYELMEDESIKHIGKSINDDTNDGNVDSNNKNNKTKKPSSLIFLDQDADRFRFILDWMCNDDGKVYLPITISKQALVQDLKSLRLIPEHEQGDNFDASSIDDAWGVSSSATSSLMNRTILSTFDDSTGLPLASTSLVNHGENTKNEFMKKRMQELAFFLFGQFVCWGVSNGNVVEKTYECTSIEHEKMKFLIPIDDNLLDKYLHAYGLTVEHFSGSEITSFHFVVRKVDSSSSSSSTNKRKVTTTTEPAMPSPTPKTSTPFTPSSSTASPLPSASSTSSQPPKATLLTGDDNEKDPVQKSV